MLNNFYYIFSILVKDATDTNTSVSVIRLSSPTPSLQQELDEQEKLEREMAKAHEEETDNDEDNNDEEKDDGEEDENEKLPVEKVPHVSLTVENFFNPSEAKQLASEILSKCCFYIFYVLFFNSIYRRYCWNIKSSTNCC